VDEVEHESHLSRIETHWTAVVRAHRGPVGDAGAARAALLERYGGAVRRYLLASLRDVDGADELAQEFALRFLRGDFKNADPGRGRFRHFVKRAVYNLMVDYHRTRQARPRPLDDGVPEPAAATDAPMLRDHDFRFLESWRGELMAKAWAALDQLQARTGQPFADVLRLRVEQPEVRSPQLAELLSARLARPVNAGWVRTNLHRARDLFVESLVREVTQSLEDPSPERLKAELDELGLLDRCRPALKRAGLGC
jgi:DNA-directed RNA polymerase specialized sigma24 family protein